MLHLGPLLVSCDHSRDLPRRSGISSHGATMSMLYRTASAAKPGSRRFHYHRPRHQCRTGDNLRAEDSLHKQLQLVQGAANDKVSIGGELADLSPSAGLWSSNIRSAALLRD